MASVASTFKTHEPSLPELLDDIHKGTIQLPDFQRGWVWDDDRIRALIASVSLSYPIGAVMLMETGDAGLRFQAPACGRCAVNEWQQAGEVDPRRPAAAHFTLHVAS